MNARVKDIRKSLDMTMEKFGERLGVTKTAISNIESGNRNVTEQMLKAICREFNVNEEWLRSGIGEMFNDNNDKEKLAYLIETRLPKFDAFQTNVLLELFELPEEYWRLAKEYVHRLVLAEEPSEKQKNNASTMPDYLTINAAHAIEGASDEDKQHDEDIMDDDNF